MKWRNAVLFTSALILIFMFNNCGQFRTMGDINPTGNQIVQNSNSNQTPASAPAPTQQNTPSPAPTSPSTPSNPSPTPVPMPTPSNNKGVWGNEPAQFKVITDWGFDSLNGGGWHDEGGSVSIASDPTAPISKNNVLQQYFPKGMVAGISPGNNWTVFTPTAELYMGFYWKGSAGFQQHSSGRTKIIFVSDNGGNPLFFYYGGGYSGIKPFIGMQHQNSDICNDHLSGYPGICGTWDIPSGETFNLGEWVKIEFYVKKSTTPTSKDGILKFWVNGKLARSFTNWNSGSNLFTSVPIVPVWGGVGGNKLQDDYFWYDHIHLSAP